ncbi:unnamed protein product [Rotaria magnacalcarata]|uniref:Uncharacterized protein n=1 Tax=Rotaria magnacalcarata TaxID=392030 RepID=A0A816M0R6_9BILA|nr:unnamed protein product [Rotaria magnacalcarata]CAF1649957.1 unnamed protein product [Rotaria magnacalcarata]CAF1952906.1 unnamed protein product [Rotaria magnacalcarata]CAF2072472.1 unnamed protein product [Rotaria magnacalcarata]CAF2199868.1 unnamed protein product [Rotaria magnacalcarata]
MATNKWYIISIQLIIFVLNKINGQTLKTVPCQPVLKNYFDYLTLPHPYVVRYLSIQATFILENRYVAYYAGSLTYVKSIDSLNGTVTVSFSDRTWIPSCGLLFCPYQNFNYKNTDTQTIVINRLGSIKYILNSWGNAKFTDQLQCYGMNEPLYTAPTAGSASMFVMTLQEQQYSIPK